MKGERIMTELKHITISIVKKRILDILSNPKIGHGEETLDEYLKKRGIVIEE